MERLNLKKYLKKHLAFTIAEILIVLGIIGVIAEMTMPEVIQNADETKYRSFTETMYSQIYSAYSSMKDENGGSLVSAFSSDSDLFNAFASKFTYSDRADGAANTRSLCYFPTYYPFITDMTHGGILTTTPVGCLRLRNGATLTQVNITGGATAYNNYKCNVPPNKICTYLIVDMNDSNGPNIVFKDISIFSIGPDKIFVDSVSYPPNTQTAFVSYVYNGAVRAHYLDGTYLYDFQW